MKNIFVKAFVSPFYKAYFGFFVVVFIVFGLLMEAPQHIKIGERILQHPFAFATLLLVFVIYGLLQYRFHINLIQGLKYRVFHQLALFNAKDFSRYQLGVWICNHLLLLFYASFLTYLAIEMGYWYQPFFLWFLLTVMFFAHKNLLVTMLSQALPEQKPIPLKQYGLKNFPIKRAYWLLVHLKENRPLLLLASKILQLILLKLFFYSYTTDTYDERWLQFGLLCVAYINFPIWLEKKEFEQGKLAYFLNLPRPFLRKAWLHLYSTLQIIVAELLYLAIHFPDLPNSGQALSLSLLLISLNLGLYAIINSSKEISDLPRNAIFSFFSLFFLIIFGFPVLLISGLGLFAFLVSIHSAYKQ